MPDPLASLVDVIGQYLRDLERLLAVQGAGLDRAFVRRTLVDVLGEDAEQVAAWDRLARG